MTADIKKIFTTIANENDAMRGSPPPIREARISPLFYQYLRNLHRDASTFLDKLEIVMEDGEHQLLMTEGSQCGYTLPDEQDFRRRMKEFRAHLDSYDPSAVTFVRGRRADGQDAKTVVVPGAVARGFFLTALESADFMDNFINVLKGSQYFPWIRKLKENGVPYAGPTSVREFYVTFFSLCMAGAQARQEALPSKMPPNWTRRPMPQVA